MNPKKELLCGLWVNPNAAEESDPAFEFVGERDVWSWPFPEASGSYVYKENILGNPKKIGYSLKL